MSNSIPPGGRDLPPECNRHDHGGVRHRDDGHHDHGDDQQQQQEQQHLDQQGMDEYYNDRGNHYSSDDIIGDSSNVSNGGDYSNGDYTDYSSSGLTGGFTTITNIDAGLIEHGNQSKASKSVFQFVGGVQCCSPPTAHQATHRTQEGGSGDDNGGEDGGGSNGCGGCGDDSKESNNNMGSYESYYKMQRQGPFITSTNIRHHDIFQHHHSSLADFNEHADYNNDYNNGHANNYNNNNENEHSNAHRGEGGGFCSHAEYGNASSEVDTNDNDSEDHANSSLSSITHDFFPKFDDRGRFTNYGKRIIVSHTSSGSNRNHHRPANSKERNSKHSKETTTSSSRRRSLSKVDLFFSSQRKLVNGRSPWYSISRMQLEPEPHHQQQQQQQQQRQQHTMMDDSPPSRELPQNLIFEKTPPRENSNNGPNNFDNQNLKLPSNNDENLKLPPPPLPPPPPPNPPPEQSSSSAIILRPPKEVVVIPKHATHHFEHFNKAFRNIPINIHASTPSVISSNLSQLFNNDLRGRYRRSNHHAHRSYGRWVPRLSGLFGFGGGQCGTGVAGGVGGSNTNGGRTRKKGAVVCVTVSLFIVIVVTIGVIVSGPNTGRPPAIEGGVIINDYEQAVLPNKGDELPQVCCLKDNKLDDHVATTPSDNGDGAANDGGGDKDAQVEDDSHHDDHRDGHDGEAAIISKSQVDIHHSNAPEDASKPWEGEYGTSASPPPTESFKNIALPPSSGAGPTTERPDEVPDNAGEDDTSSSQSSQSSQQRPQEFDSDIASPQQEEAVLMANEQISVSQVLEPTIITEGSSNTRKPTPNPTNEPSERPTLLPTRKPTRRPSRHPTRHPTRVPTNSPSKKPVLPQWLLGLESYTPPTNQPSSSPTRRPTDAPSRRPTSPPIEPTERPITILESMMTMTHSLPTPPTRRPTPDPTRRPTGRPATSRPTERPTRKPSKRPTRRPTPEPTRPIPTPPPLSSSSTSAVLTATDVTLNRGRANKNYGMEEYLTVKGDGHGVGDRVALIKFDIGVLGEYNVGRAILRLYSVRNDKFDEEDEGGSHEVGGIGGPGGPGVGSKVSVSILTRAPNWDEDEITYSNAPSDIKTTTRHKVLPVTSFRVRAPSSAPPSHRGKTTLHEVDVSWGVRTSLGLPGVVGGHKGPPHQRLWVKEYITFELRTEAGERVDFASREWEGGGAEPALEIVFKDPTLAPTRQPVTKWPTKAPSTKSPTREPTSFPTTSHPTKSPTDEPTRAPTKEPTEEPTKEPTKESTEAPTKEPTEQPTKQPTAEPTTTASTDEPTAKPVTAPPSPSPIQPTAMPTDSPTSFYEPCPEDYVPPTIPPQNIYVTGNSVSYQTHPSSSSKHVFKCQSTAHCNMFGPSRGPPHRGLRQRQLPTHANAWELVGWCNSPITLKPTPPPTTGEPSSRPSAKPSSKPTLRPTSWPTKGKTWKETPPPKKFPTSQPTRAPTSEPTPPPSPPPTRAPTLEPTPPPSPLPTRAPTLEPTPPPSPPPTRAPTLEPSPPPSPPPTTNAPTPEPSAKPTRDPTTEPSTKPTLDPITFEPTYDFE